MKQRSFLSHTPAEMRRFSNLSHIVEGALFTIVGVLSLLGNFAAFPWASSAWPILVLISGILLLLLLYPRYPISEWPLIWRDAQQRQHTIIAGAIAIAGLAELLSYASPALDYAWPVVLLITAVQLLLYREPEGAYEGGAEHGGHAGHYSLLHVRIFLRSLIRNQPE